VSLKGHKIFFIIKEVIPMGTIPIKDLLDKWRLETLSPEMAIGHLLQHVGQLWSEIVTIRQRLTELTNTLTETHRVQARMHGDIDRLLKHAGLPPSGLDAPPRGRPPKKK
jgi:ABC-type glutathione transport system ATPase component